MLGTYRTSEALPRHTCHLSRARAGAGVKSSDQSIDQSINQSSASMLAVPTCALVCPLKASAAATLALSTGVSDGSSNSMEDKFCAVSCHTLVARTLTA